MTPWLVVGGVVVATLLCHRYWLNWLDIYDEVFSHGGMEVEVFMLLLMTLFIAALTWPVVLPFMALKYLLSLVPHPKMGGLGKWVEAFYTLDREERKRVLND